MTPRSACLLYQLQLLREKAAPSWRIREIKAREERDVPETKR